MSGIVMSLWAKIMGFVAALLSGLIFVFGSLSATLFGQTYLDYLMVELGLAADAAAALEMLMIIASYAGWIILAAAVLIILGRVRIAKLILLIVIGSGLLSFFIPVVAALVNGTISLEVLLNGTATTYLVATLFGIIAKLYCDKAT